MSQEPEVKAAPAQDQLTLALERTWLAHERTLMAWIRTSASLITFGFALYKVVFYVHEQDPAKTTMRAFGSRAFGLVLIGTGVLALVLATLQNRQQVKRFRGQYAQAPVSLSLMLAALIAGLGSVAFVVALLHE